MKNIIAYLYLSKFTKPLADYLENICCLYNTSRTVRIYF
jgi:hypothetical protein